MLSKYLITFTFSSNIIKVIGTTGIPTKLMLQQMDPHQPINLMP